MTDNSITKENMLNLCKYGTYYNPATKHYNNNANVVCDRCFRNNLDACIGWQTYDLCLQCVNTVNNDPLSKPTKPSEPKYVVTTTNMMQGQFRPKKPEREDLVRMMQRQFKNDEDSYKTYMMQSQFK